MPYSIFFFDEGFTDDDLFDPRSDSDAYDPDSPCSSCMKEACYGCDIAEPEVYHECISNRAWDCLSGDVF